MGIGNITMRVSQLRIYPWMFGVDPSSRLATETVRNCLRTGNKDIIAAGSRIGRGGIQKKGRKGWPCRRVGRRKTVKDGRVTQLANVAELFAPTRNSAGAVVVVSARAYQSAFTRDDLLILLKRLDSGNRPRWLASLRKLLQALKLVEVEV